MAPRPSSRAESGIDSWPGTTFPELARIAATVGEAQDEGGITLVKAYTIAAALRALPRSDHRRGLRAAPR
ncbi:hypothetical protein RHCRD62_30211 [Rhodococcus sp. RD6.2]|uniref:hypothetical protein n=1 Tax=Rhodococcus sp. RD6.2 TaxID=260936 RepID=UPI00063B8A3B|nr:hypothetical protein [Rhodococcus sp. RD6.2]CRK51547.1 hypothetical protein RHCRD62_30211 [Rhodococcus sp. RD6.2]